MYDDPYDEHREVGGHPTPPPLPPFRSAYYRALARHARSHRRSAPAAAVATTDEAPIIRERE